MYVCVCEFKLNLIPVWRRRASALYDAVRRVLGDLSRAHTRTMSSSSSPCARARAQGARGVVRAVRQHRAGAGALARANAATRAVVRGNAARATRQMRVVVVVGAISGSDRAKTSSTGGQGEENGDESSSLLDISTSSSTTDARGPTFSGELCSAPCFWVPPRPMPTMSSRTAARHPTRVSPIVPSQFPSPLMTFSWTSVARPQVLG